MGENEKGRSETVAGDTTAPTVLTPIDIQQKEFRVSRFGGYKMRDVDEFLDRITDTFTAMTAEIDRLRASGDRPVVGAPDLDDVSRQADEIIARARAEAARIARQTRTEGAATAAPATGGDGAVNEFILQERQFLQSLAGLVQEHAETVKTMARSARPVPAPRPAPPEAAASPRAEAAAPSPRPAAEATEGVARPPADASAGATLDAPAPAPVPEADAPAPEPTRVPDTPAAVRVDEPTVRVDEPTHAGASRGEPPAEGDRSLRELFWGED